MNQGQYQGLLDAIRELTAQLDEIRRTTARIDRRLKDAAEVLSDDALAQPREEADSGRGR